jgi:hypothetical protein
MEGLGAILGCELDRASGDFTAGDDEFTDRNGKLEATRAGAARIDEQHAIALFHERPVRMTGNDHLDAGAAWLDVELIEVMDHVKEHRFELDQLRFTKPICPSASVVVAFDGHYRREGAQPPKDVRVCDVASVNDLIAPTQESQCLRSQQAVSVRNEAYAKHDAAEWGLTFELRGGAKGASLPSCCRSTKPREFASSHTGRRGHDVRQASMTSE